MKRHPGLKKSHPLDSNVAFSKPYTTKQKQKPAKFENPDELSEKSPQFRSRKIN